MQAGNELITFLVSLLGGGGIGGAVGFNFVKAYIRSEAREAVSFDVKKLEHEDEALHKRINHVENEYVQCKHCNTQHSGLNMTLGSMDHKLDILIEKKMR